MDQETRRKLSGQRPPRVPAQDVDSPIFYDHNGTPYTVSGGVGGVTVNGTNARVWVTSYTRSGYPAYSRGIRLDLATAKRFRDWLNTAIAKAEAAEQEFYAAIERNGPGSGS